MSDSPQTALMETQLLHPITGEVLGPAAPLSSLAHARWELIDLKRQIDAFTRDLDDEIARRADFEGTGTLHAGIYTLTVPKPTKTGWDEHELGIALEALVNDGRISRAKAQRALEKVVTYKPKPVELNQLLTHADPEVAQTIAACQHDVEQNRRVSVKVRRGRPVIEAEVADPTAIEP